MLGTLPKTLSVNGKIYNIRTDFRDILTVISAFNDADLTDQEKVYVCLKRIFIDMPVIPHDDYQAAYESASKFIECQPHNDRPSPRVVNWVKDEQLIFPAINKAAGMEVRAVPYMHWWTFLGYFQSIDREGTYGFILSLRQKKAKGKKLEPYEKEFYTANRNLCAVDIRKISKTPEDTAMRIYEELMREGADNGKHN